MGTIAYFSGLISGSSKVVETTTYEVWLVGGQSNTDGRAPITSDDAPDYMSDAIVDGVMVFNGSKITEHNLNDKGSTGDGRGWVYKISDCYSFVDIASYKLVNESNKDIILIQVTEGGTSIAEANNVRGTWSANYEDKTYDDIPYLLEELKDRYESFVTWASDNNIDFELKGMFWHQGETDSDYGKSSSYQTNFEAVIDDVRGWTGDSVLPIVFGTVSHNSNSYNETIETAQLYVAENDDNAYCIDNSDKTLLDSWHFDSESSNEFGEEVYDIAKNI